MNTMEWGMAGAIVAAISAALTVPVLWLTVRAERRATERSHVEWVALEQEPGVILVLNQGLDVARSVTTRAWDRHSSARATADELARPDALTLVLEYRRARGPDPTDVPHPVAPRVSEDPPEIPDAFGSDPPPALANMRAQWERMKAMQDAADEQHARLVRDAELGQVSVTVAWRSRRGVWSYSDVPVGAAPASQ